MCKKIVSSSFATFGNIIEVCKSAHFNEIFYNISKSIKYLFVFKNISES